MKIIYTRKQEKIFVDDNDYEWLNKTTWYLDKDGYAVSSKRIGLRKEGKQIKYFMHRLILNPPKNYQSDHINGVKLDNRRNNLRAATPSQNQHNSRLRKDNTSGYKGIVKHYERWQAVICINKKDISLGVFNTKEEAAVAYNIGAKKYFGEFANINQL